MSGLSTGSRFQGHELGAVLARSALTVVFLAVERRSGALLAVKAPSPEYAGEAGLRERLRHERAVGVELRHPHLVRVREAPQDPDRPCVVMDYLPGVSLRELLSASRLSEPQALDLACQVCECLDYLHRRGGCHGLLTPGHVRVSSDGQARVMDLAHATTAAHPVSPAGTGVAVSTMAYLAPEQLRGHPPSPEGDVYALGVVLQELLTGIPPFAGCSFSSVLREKLTNAFLPEAPAPVDAALRELIRQATAREARRRPQAGELLAALRRRRGGAPPAGARSVLV